MLKIKKFIQKKLQKYKFVYANMNYNVGMLNSGNKTVESHHTLMN